MIITKGNISKTLVGAFTIFFVTVNHFNRLYTGLTLSGRVARWESTGMYVRKQTTKFGTFSKYIHTYTRLLHNKGGGNMGKRVFISSSHFLCTVVELGVQNWLAQKSFVILNSPLEIFLRYFYKIEHFFRWSFHSLSSEWAKKYNLQLPTYQSLDTFVGLRPSWLEWGHCGPNQYFKKKLTLLDLTSNF